MNAIQALSQLSYSPEPCSAPLWAAGNQIIENTYDALDRVDTTSVPQPGGAPAILTTTTYDLASRVTGKSDNTGMSLTTGFDSAKRPISVTQGAPTFAGTRVVSYLLDLAGNKTRTTWADGYYVTYAYDALNRMTTATENGTFLLSTYIYDTLSRRTSLVYGNGASQGYTYSTQGDLLTLASTLTGTANTTTNTFTKAHQLASETASNTAWGYIPAAFQTTNYSPANNLNQYVNVTVGANPTATLGYDANGNLTGDGTWTYAYDAQNMLRSSTSAPSTSLYQYDPLGRRQFLNNNGVITTFAHDGDEEIADFDSASTLLRRYVPGPGTDMPIAMVTPSGGSNVRKYFHTNRQGSTIAMSADDGTMAEGPYTYDAYGNGAPATGVPFKYTGRRLDAGTGLYYYRARYYSAALGRSLQVDAIGNFDDMNLYGYASNDAINFIDPTGMSRKSGVMLFFGVAGTITHPRYPLGITVGVGKYVQATYSERDGFSVETGNYWFGGGVVGNNKSIGVFAGVATYDTEEFSGLGVHSELNFPVPALQPLLGLGGSAAIGGAMNADTFEFTCCAANAGIGWGSGGSVDVTWTTVTPDSCAFCGWSSAEVGLVRGIAKTAIGAIGKGVFRGSGRISSRKLSKEIEHTKKVLTELVSYIDNTQKK